MDCEIILYNSSAQRLKYVNVVCCVVHVMLWECNVEMIKLVCSNTPLLTWWLAGGAVVQPNAGQLPGQIEGPHRWRRHQLQQAHHPNHHFSRTTATDFPRVVSCVCVCVRRVSFCGCHDISAFNEIGKLLTEKVTQYDDVVVGFLTDGTPTHTFTFQ